MLYEGIVFLSMCVAQLVGVKLVTAAAVITMNRLLPERVKLPVVSEAPHSCPSYLTQFV